MSIVDTIKNCNIGLSEGEIEGILYLILNEKELTNSGLIRKTGLPKETLKRFKMAISSFLEESSSEKILFKQESTSAVKEINPRPYKWSLLSYSDTTLEDKLNKIRCKYSLESKREYDQFFATTQTSIAKVGVMTDRSDIKSKRIALLGDDDLISVVLSLSGEDYTQITVLDIDRDILRTIDEIVAEYGLKNIKTEFYDARKQLRSDLIGRFDVVVTDPPYTLAGIKLFLQRSLSLLGKEQGKHIYLYYGNSPKSPEKTFQIQELLGKFGLLIKERISGFARYYGAESIGSASSLYLLETSAMTKDLPEASVAEVYTHQERHSADFPFVDHFVFRLYSVPDQVVKSKSYLQKALGSFCQCHNLKIASTQITRFSGGGYTFNYILASSNLTVHTWPEKNALHFVLVTCVPVVKQDKLYESLSSLFKTAQVEIEKID